VGVAALQNGRVFWGNDISNNAFEITTKRLSAFDSTNCAEIYDSNKSKRFSSAVIPAVLAP
jgi:DNA modification methylase